MTGGVLLDTHAAIWWWTDTPRLGREARAALEAGEVPVFVSPVTAIEIAIKFRSGKLPVVGDPITDFPALMAANHFQTLPITEAHALHAGLMAGDHRDPFDRLIAAQALAEGLIVVTRDPVFRNFGCKVLW